MTTVTQRTYIRETDFEAVSRLLVRHYRPKNHDGNWQQPAWEYMHFHPNFQPDTEDRIGIWEANGEIVGVAHHEWALGEAFFQFHPGYTWLKPEMLAYAEANLARETESGDRELQVFINDFDTNFEAITLERGYRISDYYRRPISRFWIPDPFPPIKLPAGFRVKSLADEFSLEKMHRVLWRGFNHAGDPPPEGVVWREIMTAGPNFRPDLTMVVEGPDGRFVSFCGLWYEPVNRYAYVEPMATDPDFRRMGLGKAAMMEGIRRCAAEGATVAYVGSDQPYYLATGFEKLFDSRPWKKMPTGAE
ncbi:MAG: GNAT family N-acetyltransferase [Chloroflexota bacterium]